MNWYENLGAARPVIIRNWNLPTSITEAELKLLSEAIHSDPAGFKTNINLCRFCRCLYAAVKMEADGRPECEESEEFHKFYKELLLFVEIFLTDVPCLKVSPHTSEVILYSLGFLVDLVKFVLGSIDANVSPKRVRDAIYIVKSLCKALDRHAPFHQLHEQIPVPSGLIDSPRRFVTHKSIAISSDVTGSPGKRKRCTAPAAAVNSSSFCRCTECGLCAPETNLWIKCLIEYFGRSLPGYSSDNCGFDSMKRLLPYLHELPIELTEGVLHLFSRMTESLRDDLRSNLLYPLMEFLRCVNSRCEQELDESTIETYVLILKHIRSLLNFLLPGELGLRFVRDLEQQIQRTLLSYMSAEVDTQSGMSPRSLMVCEEVSSAKSSSYFGRFFDAYRWVTVKVPLLLNRHAAHQKQVPLLSDLVERGCRLG